MFGVMSSHATCVCGRAGAGRTARKNSRSMRPRGVALAVPRLQVAADRLPTIRRLCSYRLLSTKMETVIGPLGGQARAAAVAASPQGERRSAARP